MHNFEYGSDSHIILDAGSCVPFHNFICKMFKGTHEKLELISKHRSTVKNEDLGFDMAVREDGEEARIVLGFDTPLFRRSLLRDSVSSYTPLGGGSGPTLPHREAAKVSGVGCYLIFICSRYV